MDITRKGWKCDICEEEFFEQDSGFNAKYSVEIVAYQAFNNGSNNEYTEICYKCVEKIEDTIRELSK